MNLSLTSFLVDAQKFANMEYGDKMILGLIVTAIGILMVFVILFLIILSIKLMNVCLDKLPNLSDKFKLKGKSKTKKDLNTENVDVMNIEPIFKTDDRNVVAAITAAIYALQEEENDGRKPNIAFKINSIKKYN